jgi:5-hydroxyisourate hydrolase-like protein (transthyretin family)
MRAFLQSVLIALPILATCGQSMQAQSASPATNIGHEIAGVVLNTRTGLAIRDVEVAVFRSKDNSLVVQAATDAEGRFSVTQLPDDKYSLRASHRGYIPAAFEEHENGSTAIVTGKGLVSTGIRFMLAPQAVIFGVITDDSGDPVPGATVSLYRQDPHVGTSKAVRASGTGADEQGNYEIANLAPGSYFLSVTATPWYATHRPTPGGAQPKASEPRSQLDVAYPATYYPDVADSSFAAPIAVNAGERVPINITLHPVPAIHVTMRLPVTGPNGQVSIPQLQREVFGYPEGVQSNISSATKSESSAAHSITTVEISGIAPGAYDMELNAPNGESGRVTAIDLNSDQALDLSSAISSATPLAEISGKVTMAGGDNPPSSLVAILTPEQSQNQASAPVEPDGSFHMHSVRPGIYEFAIYTINAFGYAMTTTRLTANGATLKGPLLRVGDEPVTLTATLADSTASVNGFATHDGKPSSGIFLELIPKNATAGRVAFAVNQSDSDGSFNFLHVLPGEYTLAAIQEGWMLDWTDAAAMAPYLAKGLKVTVPPHSQEINLKDSVEVQPK